MSDVISVRVAQARDYDALGALMFEAIHNGPTKYSKAQSNAWAPAPQRGTEWATRLSQKTIFMTTQSENILGFMSIEPGGYIDFAYIRPNAQGSGLFRQLFNAVESRAKDEGETSLSTHASLMAQPAFAAMGFEIDHHETVTKDGQSLARARMVKIL